MLHNSAKLADVTVYKDTTCLANKNILQPTSHFIQDGLNKTLLCR